MPFPNLRPPSPTTLSLRIKQIQRLPLRGAGAQRLKGGPPIGRGQGGGPQPSPNLHSVCGRTQLLHKIRPGKPTPGGVGGGRSRPRLVPQRRRVRREEQIPRRKIPFFGAEFASAIPRPVSARTRVEGMSLAEIARPSGGRFQRKRFSARCSVPSPASPQNPVRSSRSPAPPDSRGRSAC